MVNILGLEDHVVSVTNTPLCCCNVKLAIDNMQTNGHSYVPINIYLQKQVVAGFGPGVSLPISFFFFTRIRMCYLINSLPESSQCGMDISSPKPKGTH